MGVVSVVIPTSERGDCKGLNYAATETSLKLMSWWKRKVKRRINDLEGGKHTTYHSETHSATGGVVHVQLHKM